MSLPPIIKHIYNYGSEEVIRRGKKIFLSSGVQFMDVDHLQDQVRFRVRNDLYQNYYTVVINNYSQPKNLSLRCQCPYNLGEICRHEAAALFHLNDLVQAGFFDNTDVSYDQKHTVVRLKQVNKQLLQVFSSAANIEAAETFVTAKKVIISSSINDIVAAEVADNEDTYKVILKQNEDREFHTSCGCEESNSPLCKHKLAVFFEMLYTYGSQYFITMRNWDEQKNKLLRIYGYSLNDDLTNKFTFTYENGKPFLRVLDPNIKKIDHKETTDALKTVTKIEEKRIGIVIDTTSTHYPFIQLHLITGNSNEAEDAFISGIEKLELTQYINASYFKETDRDLIPIVRKFLPDEIMKYFKKNLPFGDFLGDYEDVFKETPSDEIKEQVWEFLLPKYQKLLERYTDYSLCFLYNSKSKSFSSKSITPIGFSSKKASPILHISNQGNCYQVILEWKIDHALITNNDVSLLNAGMIIYQDILYSINNLQALTIVETFLPNGTIEIPTNEWNLFLEETVMSWCKVLEVNFEDDLMVKSEDALPRFQLYLQEREQMLLLFPAFVYNGINIKWGENGNVIKPNNGKVQILFRHEEAEEKYIQALKNMHSDMLQNNKGHYLYLHANSVLANNWFFRFMDEVRLMNVDLFGFEGLKNLRINQYKPETKVLVSSSIDWFDAEIEIAFGDQKITIADVKRALAQKVNFVRLGDGTVGLLPEEWLKKYSLLMKMGEAKGTKIRLKKFHFSALNELMSEMDQEVVYNELEAKKERLAEIIDNDFSALPPPEQLVATLRPYQLAGFQWLSFLHEANWGGILADDMGLGKTVQALAFLQHVKNNNPDAKFLVVCPTTLMYNWENEVKKFTPSMTHYIHHGPKRVMGTKEFKDHDITITSYGTLRSDIKLFHYFEWDYAILDESQAIKNPQSQVAKSALLINAKHRLALSGTPVQNNTFDLFSQMNFLNPGLLGSREFFMNEFATPIDKFQEDEIKQQLRKLIYPFLLRRTKEQVAKDLPEKTETILFCEMGKDQRNIYDAYRVSYKDQIMGLIEERGIERSQMHILAGLTKLRQICDSPAILNEEEKFPNASIKIDEMIRELSENVGNHKALIFSQFLGMLGLLRQKMEEMHIPYAYFDGSTSTTEREKAIQLFQNNDNTRVFLISLKAGGIGLNLTAADYVYIVDPWWNPAVEQQAIDRTHRIGQTKNIFAYRLICKDTIEEKMLILQERKRALASELVADDNAFLKRLTKDDIAYLLS